MSKIIFDVTDLRKYISVHPNLSGIQRVMVMIIDDLAALQGPDDIWLGYSGTQAQTYHVRPYSALGPGGMADLENLSGFLNQTRARPTRPSLQPYADKPLKRAFHTLLRDVNAYRGNARHFTKRGTTIDAWRASRTGPPPQAHHLDTQNVFDVCAAGDTVVMLDAGWADNSWQSKDNWIHALRRKGVRIALLVHDLIQIQNPEFIPKTDPLVFYKWLYSSLATTDVYLANSKATAVDLKAFMQAHGGTQPVHTLPLAQHPVTPSQPAGRWRRVDPDLPDIPDRYARFARTWDLDDDIRSLLKWPYVLCVGTMDIRKNLWALAQVWQRLSQHRDIPLPKLVVAGRPGSFNEDFNRLMAATGNLGGWVEIRNAVSDSELDFLYRNCLFTVMPSFYEGWGLPIGESLSYGKTAVVSQTSSMPEVGQDMVEYCDPHDMASIEAACLRLIADPDHRAALEDRIARARLRSWTDVSRDLAGILAA